MAKKKKKSLKRAKKLALKQQEYSLLKLNNLATQLSSVSSYSDLPRAFNLINQFKSEAKKVTPEAFANSGLIQENKYFGMFGIADLYGYRPQGSTFWSLFPNPFGVFGYLAENYAPALICRKEYHKEIASDGYYLVGNQKNFQKAQSKFDEIGLDLLRIELVDHLKMFGNFWIWPRKNILGGVKDYKVLIPQYLEPIFSSDGQNILAWRYQIGFVTYEFPFDALWHVSYGNNMRHYDLGYPPLSSLLVDIEADIQASMYNNMVFQKGGLIGLAVLMDSNRNSPIPGVSSLALAKQMSAELQANHSGARTGFESMVFVGAKDVKQVNKLSDMDGAFHKGSDKVTKATCHVLGVPHARAGVVTNANQIYHAASLEDKDELQFDKSIAEVLRYVDRFLNRIFIPAMGIKDVGIRAANRNNSFTANVAVALHHMAQIEGFISKDEGRQLARMPLIGGAKGQEALRVLPNMSTTSDAGFPPVIKIPTPPNEQAQFEEEFEDVNWD